MATPEATKSAEDGGDNKNGGSSVPQTEEVVVSDNPFINFMVRFPCATAGIVMLFTMICVMATALTIQSKGTDVFASSTSYEPSDKRSLEWNAFTQATKEARALSGESEDEDDERVYPQQTQDGAVVLTVYVAKEGRDNVFTSSNLQRIKEVEDTILNEKDFGKFCKREDRSGANTACRAPLSPVNLFYAPQVNIKDIFDKLDEMDGASDGKLDVMATPHLSMGLSNLHAVTLGMLGPLLSGGAAPSEDVANCIESDQSATVACLARVLVSTMENPPNKTVLDVYAATAPLVLALTAGRGEDQQDVEATLMLAAYMKTVGFYAPFVDYYFDNGFSIEHPKSKHSRGMISFGVPLEGFKNRDDRPADQDKKLEEWFSGAFSEYLKETSEVGDVEVLFFATPLIFQEFIQILLFDALKVLISLVLVFLWILAQTNSLFIAVAGVAEIILSVPVAFFLYWNVFQLRYFDGLNAMTVFIVTAIGADDIFVFMDQYKQSIFVKEVCTDLKTRMNWVYGRAAWAMFITSFTTMAAFICTAFSPLPDVKSFGIFSSIVIFVDYILVITWFPACVVFYHNYLEPRPYCCECNKCEKMWPCQRGVEETSSARALARRDDEAPQKRFMERMLSGPFAAFLKRFAPFIVVFFLILAIPLSYLASEIKELSSAEEALPSDHPFQRVATISGEAFPSSAQLANTPVYVVWGVKEFDVSGTNIMFADPKDEEAKGKLVWDSNFVFDAATQQHIWNVCDEVRRMDEPGLEDFLSRDSESTENFGKIKCPLEDWKNYVEQMNMTFPVPIAEVGETMADFMEYEAENEFGQTVTMQEKWGQALGFDKRRKEVILVILEVETKLMGRRPHPSVVLKQEYNNFEAWMDVINDPDGRLAAPASAGQAFQTSDGDFNGPNWVWMHTQSLYRSSAIQGAIIGTVLAFVVILIATQQIIIALASLVTIACILASVLAAMRLADYEMGTITSICITILAGFAVDYVVHLAHAYNHSKKETRTEKFQDAIDVIGVSVLSGMVTSVLAAVVLMFCAIQFFSKFGFFLFFTVLFAWIWGNLFFMCVMKIVGPDQNTNKWLQLPYSVLPPRGRSCCPKRYLTVTAQMQEKEP